MFQRRLTRGQMGWKMVLEIIRRFDSQTSSVFCFASQSARWSWKYRTGEASPSFSFSDAQSSPDSSECSLHSGCIWTRVRSANYNSMPNHQIPPIEKPTHTGHVGIWLGSTNGDAAGENSFRSFPLLMFNHRVIRQVPLENASFTLIPELEGSTEIWRRRNLPAVYPPDFLRLAFSSNRWVFWLVTDFQ